MIWEPRDLVGGDIYWVHTHGNSTSVADIDCTGHGVPGGFMTMLATATLDRIYADNENFQPGRALARLSDLTKQLLNQDRDTSASNDGMDAGICRIDRSTGQLTFAGARLSLMVKHKQKCNAFQGIELVSATLIHPKRLSLLSIN